MSGLLEAIGTGTYQLRGELCIHRAAEVFQTLESLADADTVISVDLGGVAEIDTAGLQLLLMLKRVVPTGVRFCNHSAAVAEAIALIQLEGELGESAAPATGNPA